MVEVDGIGVQDVGVVSCCGIHVLVELAGIEGGVVVIADSEGDGVGGSRLESASSAHEVLRECRLGGLVEVVAAPTGSRAMGTASASPPPGRGGIGVIVMVVGRGHCVVRVRCLSRGFELVYCASAIEMRFLVVVGAALS